MQPGGIWQLVISLVSHDVKLCQLLGDVSPSPCEAVAGFYITSHRSTLHPSFRPLHLFPTYCTDIFVGDMLSQAERSCLLHGAERGQVQCHPPVECTF